MIRGLHGLFYSSEPDAAREFLRDKLQLPHTDVGGGWLIFDLPEADLGIHPTEPGQKGGAHDVSFYCDDIEGTVADLKSRGVAFEEYEMPGRAPDAPIYTDGGARAAWFKDTEGNIMALIQTL